jgi:hypothetical protein
MDVEVEPFGRLTDRQRRELADEAARVALTFGAAAALVEK